MASHVINSMELMPSTSMPYSDICEDEEDMIPLEELAPYIGRGDKNVKVEQCVSIPVSSKHDNDFCSSTQDQSIDELLELLIIEVNRNVIGTFNASKHDKTQETEETETQKLKTSISEDNTSSNIKHEIGNGRLLKRLSYDSETDDVIKSPKMRKVHISHVDSCVKPGNFRLKSPDYDDSYVAKDSNEDYKHKNPDKYGTDETCELQQRLYCDSKIELKYKNGDRFQDYRSHPKKYSDVSYYGRKDSDSYNEHYHQEKNYSSGDHKKHAAHNRCQDDRKEDYARHNYNKNTYGHMRYQNNRWQTQHKDDYHWHSPTYRNEQFRSKYTNKREIHREGSEQLEAMPVDKCALYRTSESNRNTAHGNDEICVDRDHDTEETCNSQSAATSLRIEKITVASKEYICDICNRKFRGKCAMLRHRNTHVGVQSHRCGTCNKTFAEKKLLMQHNLIHAGSRPFLCVLCSKGFLTQSNLNKHKKTIHDAKEKIVKTDSGSFSCYKCSKRFSFKYELKRHMFFLHKTRSDISMMHKLP